jgi:hypothetical protein
MAGPRTSRRKLARTTIDVEPDWLEEPADPPPASAPKMSPPRPSKAPKPKLPSKMPPVPTSARRSGNSQPIEVDPSWVYEDEPAKEDAPARPPRKSLRPAKSPPSLPPASKATPKAPPRPSRRPRPPPIPRGE